MSMNQLNYECARVKNDGQTAIEMFGTPINIVDGMMRLNDIRAAYLKEIGEDPKTSRKKRLDAWEATDSYQELLGYMLNELPIPRDGVLESSWTVLSTT